MIYRECSCCGLLLPYPQGTAIPNGDLLCGCCLEKWKEEQANNFWENLP